MSSNGKEKYSPSAFREEGVRYDLWSGAGSLKICCPFFKFCLLFFEILLFCFFSRYSACFLVPLHVVLLFLFLHSHSQFLAPLYIKYEKELDFYLINIYSNYKSNSIT